MHNEILAVHTLNDRTMQNINRRNVIYGRYGRKSEKRTYALR
jgi:hypothetical protein